MSDLNTVSIVGNICKDPEMRQTPSGKMVCDILVANNRYTNPPDLVEPIKHTTYVKITLWNGRAEKWGATLGKGDKVFVSGRLVDDNYRPKDQELTTKGRLRIDNVETITLVRKAIPKEENQDT